HTLNGKHFEDICDTLQGTYPKTFKFVGWHPFCRCIAVPKLADEDEFIERQQALIDGNESDVQFSGVVTDMPENFKEWVRENADRIEGAQSLPYFIRDNRKQIERATRAAISNSTDTETKETDNEVSTPIKERRREIKKQAKSVFRETNLAHPSFNAPITVSNAAIKEWLNQPFGEYETKNEMLLDLPTAFADTIYLGSTEYNKNRKEVLKNHIFETEVNGKKAWIIVHELAWGEFRLHSISDSDKVKPK
ncbi:MAG: hypothetical protein J1F05_07035, partial [Muribaculaceae bacterium]|nr:hypothetical protein [Muribaculaceae bacterium]